ncbi:hypothetical protein B0T10DRAFT_397431 [Thelonectria olida]|uniref:Ipa protein n=1 Tax=Thelonectria olida TaxID=1576542 RepID=A0A9P9AR88_9HYPO|nr:hypothetical protein B0T10DRAFT_397431 [Thelonectria olida]
MVKELHEDLAHKYKLHAATIESAWRSFNKAQRTKCVKVGAADGVVLKNPEDRSLGNVYKMMPEWNLRDITAPGSDFLLDHLKYRASKSLFEQYLGGPNDGPGDYGIIIDSMRTKNLRHVDSYEDSYTFFLDEKYGASFKLLSEKAETLAEFAPAIKAGLCVPQSTGELILHRQIFFLQSLIIIIDDILEEGSKTRSQKERPKKSDKAATAAFSHLSIHSSRPKLALPDLTASAQDQDDSVVEYLGLLVSEPVVLAHALNICFFSRPELLVDEKGRHLPVHTDKYVSGALFETVHNAVKGTAIWKYIVRLLELLETSAGDKAYRAVLLQELSNLCHFEYGRAQALFRRRVHAGTGTKWFKRMSNRYDHAGNARVTMKGSPEELTRSDPQLHYVLRLCQAETTAPKAVEWMTKLCSLHEAHPLEREKLAESEADSLSDLAIIIGFIQDLSSVVSLPSASRKKGQVFLSRWQELDIELSPLKKEIDVRDFATPIDNLLEPGMADNALKKLEEFVIEKAGTKMGFLYQDLIEESLSDLQTQYQQEKAKLEQKDKGKVEYVPPISTSQLPDERLEQRKQKEKTRPATSPTYEITPRPEKASVEEPTAPTATFTVSATTAEVFSTLFSQSKSRGSVSWAAFEGAMAALGFSVLPKFGSVITFYPPDTMSERKPLTLHRPHASHIEGYLSFIYARRLKRAYGWSEDTFQVL